MRRDIGCLEMDLGDTGIVAGDQPVQDLGKRHKGYGVTAAHYAPVGAALLWTLEKGLGPDFTPDVKAAWTETYTALAGVMTAA